MVTDPDITDKEYTENTPIGCKKIAELRAEVERERHDSIPTQNK
jgi:hypothetical protein